MPTITTNFSARDYTALFEWLLTILREECPEYTDLNYSDAGQALLRLIARVSDSLSLYIDEAFAESFIHSAKFKQSLIDIARTVDLLPKMANSASSSVRLTRRSSLIGNVGDTGIISIPKYSLVGKPDGIPYLLMEDIYMLPSDLTKNVSIVQGQITSRTLTINDFSQDMNTGRWYYNLGPKVSAGFVTFTENSVIEWTEEESFWRSHSTDKHFVLESYADLYNGIADTTFFSVGNGIQGSPLTSGSTYLLTYIQGDGVLGNAGIGIINTISEDYSFLVNVTNTVAATGGASVESIEDFRVRIPKVVRTQRRAVTKEDYEALVVSVPGVKRVQAADRNDSGEFPWEYVILYIVPEGGGNMSESLEASVMSVCTQKGALGGWYKRYLLYNASEYPIDVTCTIGVSYGYNSSAVISSVTAAINSFFYVDNFDISEVFYKGDLHSTLMAVPGVSWVELPGVETTNPGVGNIIVLGGVSVSVSI